MKKVWSLLLVLVLLFGMVGLVGCNSSEVEDEDGSDNEDVVSDTIDDTYLGAWQGSYSDTGKNPYTLLLLEDGVMKMLYRTVLVTGTWEKTDTGIVLHNPNAKDPESLTLEDGKLSGENSPVFARVAKLSTEKANKALCGTWKITGADYDGEQKTREETIDALGELELTLEGDTFDLHRVDQAEEGEENMDATGRWYRAEDLLLVETDSYGDTATYKDGVLGMPIDGVIVFFEKK